MGLVGAEAALVGAALGALAAQFVIVVRFVEEFVALANLILKVDDVLVELVLESALLLQLLEHLLVLSPHQLQILFLLVAHGLQPRQLLPEGCLLSPRFLLECLL